MLLDKEEGCSGATRVQPSEGNNCSDSFNLPSELTERQALWLSRRLAVSIAIARTIAGLGFQHGRAG
jgi:hypothetical protein